MTTEEMLAEALRLLARAENLIPSGGFAQLGALGAQWHSDYRHADNSFLAAHDQARAGHYGKSVEHGGLEKHRGAQEACPAPDCGPPDAGSVGQAPNPLAFLDGGMRSMTDAERAEMAKLRKRLFKPDPQPAPLVLSKTVLKTLALQGQPPSHPKK